MSVDYDVHGVEHPEFDVIDMLANDRDVKSVLALTSDPVDVKFAEFLCHWLVVFWVESGERELHEYEVESELSQFAADALQQQVLAHCNDLER